MARRNASPNEVVGPALVPMGEHAGKPAFPLARSITIIGTRRSADLRLKSSTVSRAHAAIVNTTSGVYLRDLCSREGVLVNDRRIVDAELKRGDQIRIGRFTLCFVPGPEQAYDPHRRQLRPGHIVIDGKKKIDLRRRIVFVSRREASDIRLDDESVSVAHAVIFQYHGRHYLRDLGSQSGTRVNKLPAKLVVLRDGDVIRVGNHELRYFTIATRAEQQPAREAEAIELELASVEPQAPSADAEPSGESIDASDSGTAIAVEINDAELPEASFASNDAEAIQPQTVESTVTAPLPLSVDPELSSTPSADVEAAATLAAPAVPPPDQPIATDSTGGEAAALPDCDETPREAVAIGDDHNTGGPADTETVHSTATMAMEAPAEAAPAPQEQPVNVAFPSPKQPLEPTPAPPKQYRNDVASSVKRPLRNASPVSERPAADAPAPSEQPEAPEEDARPPLPDGWIELAFGRQQPTPSKARQRRRRWLFWQRSE